MWPPTAACRSPRPRFIPLVEGQVHTLAPATCKCNNLCTQLVLLQGGPTTLFPFPVFVRSGLIKKLNQMGTGLSGQYYFITRRYFRLESKHFTDFGGGYSCVWRDYPPPSPFFSYTHASGLNSVYEIAFEGFGATEKSVSRPWWSPLVPQTHRRS